MVGCHPCVEVLWILAHGLQPGDIVQAVEVVWNTDNPESQQDMYHN
jgi:hypothetical protein